MRFLLPLILVLATCWADPSPLFDNVPPQLFEEEKDNYRLPRNVVPINYLIDLEVYLDTEKGEKDFYYNGKSTIFLSFGNVTKDITFHAKNLEISKNASFVQYTRDDDMPKTIKVIDIKTVEYKDFVTLTLEEEINSSMKKLQLHLFYTGELTDGTEGFYKRSYENEKGKQRWLAATHFEPLGARQAFPCWDEPDIKTPFVISITAPKGYQTISNMVVAKQDQSGKTTFMQTPNIPTYLVAFVIADYKRIESKDKLYGIWTKSQDSESADFAFDYGQEVLDKMAEFTGIKYYDLKKGTKMDQIAIPDFGPGGMENWGLVMYRESGLLYTKGKTLTEDKQDIATVISHELAHQWFGNLVTCEWWNAIWLNEGFASFFQYYIANQVAESEAWDIMEQFVVKTLHPVFVTDAAVETRPLEPEITAQTRNQIKSLFDDIAYKKGASILRMMQEFLGDDVFQSGLKNYLKIYQFQSVTSNNLFNAIQAAAPKKVKDALPENKSLMGVMKNWVKEAGYPIVTVNENSDTIFNLTQERFFMATNNHDKTQWYIPITYITEDSPQKKEQVWMNPDEYLKIQHNKDQWVIINADQKGYYRVNYDDANWKRLSEYLTDEFYKNISSTNRAQLIDDALTLARVGRTNYDSALDITKYLSHETDYVPWVAAVKAFDYLDNVLQSSSQYPSYKIYVTQLIETFANTINYTQPTTSDKHIQRLSQVLVLNTACKYGLKSCEDFASKKFGEWLEPKKPEKTAEEKEEKEELPIDYRNGILCAGLRNADQGTWDKTVEKYKSSKDQDEKYDILAGLGCASSAIAEVFLASTLDSKAKFPINVFEAMNSIYEGNGNSLDLLIKFINDNLEKIQKADDKDGNLLRVVLNKLSTRVTTNEQFVELSLLVYGKLHIYNDFKVNYALDNLAWLKSHQEVVEKWIQNQPGTEEDDNNSTSSVTVTSLSLLIASVLFARFY